MANKNILLIEPGYRNKYPPLGLMKIAAYHGADGKQDNVRFIKGEDKSVLGEAWDRVYVTTLFSFEYERISRAIDFALEVVRGQASKVFVGGIAASLMNGRFAAEPRWRGIRFIAGLLDKSPAESLQLDEFEEELYADDTTSAPIETLVPDYGILSQIEYRYPVHDAYFLYASRGCIRTCSFCGVPKLEGGLRETPSITAIVREIERRYGAKKDLTFMDNNITASPKLKEIMDEVVDLGFGRGATITRRGVAIQRRVDFNQGVDARELAKNPELMRQLARVCVSPLRIAFDHLGFRDDYESAIRQAEANGLKDLSNYMLYNFKEAPADLFERMYLNVHLNEELGIRIFSFPMRYQPVDMIDRSHVGLKWTRHQLRSVQVILQATHGIVSGAPDFFREAFGSTSEEFMNLLLRPHHMIFNRFWYKSGGGGEGEFADFQAAFNKLSESQKIEALNLLSEAMFDLPGKPRLSREQLRDRFVRERDDVLRRVLEFYIPPTKDEERRIWDLQKVVRGKAEADASFGLAEDVVVEDAGLQYFTDEAETSEKQVA
ncbi:radical SAM protein [Magnetospirillum moscoviense]|uniref:Radical SAM protein n=1 Tax=Magnetospirillum moscoviense TaxID=1437059 RepID=A0A178MJK1_9PROT|nr:radical SAM protein [Magnetospirillum moscoviense]OAN48317.1 radical SAM protein [Magnetospirillum moscoviense]